MSESLHEVVTWLTYTGHVFTKAQPIVNDYSEVANRIGEHDVAFSNPNRCVGM